MEFLASVPGEPWLAAREALTMSLEHLFSSLHVLAWISSQWAAKQPCPYQVVKGCCR